MSARAALLLLFLPGCLSASPAIVETVAAHEALLWRHPFPKITVEVDFVEGREPSPAALAQMLETLEEVTDKEVVLLGPDRIDLGRPPDPEHRWTDEELRAVDAKTRAERFRGVVGEGDSAYLHVLYLDGSDADSPDALGINSGVRILMFIRAGTTPASTGGVYRVDVAVERSVLIHETGHALGLVNAGVPMVRPHEDANDPRHSNNPESVMYPGIDAARKYLELLADGRGAPYKFDADDLADLAAFRASEPT